MRSQQNILIFNMVQTTPYWSAQEKPVHSGQVWSHQLGHFASTLADLSLQLSPDTLPKSLWKIPIFKRNCYSRKINQNAALHQDSTEKLNNGVHLQM